MKAKLTRDNKKRALVQEWDLERRRLKAILKDEYSSNQEKLEAQKVLTSLPKDSSITRVRNRCTVTGRGRAVYKKFRISRIQLRQQSLQGNLPGCTKSNW